MQHEQHEQGTAQQVIEQDITQQEPEQDTVQPEQSTTQQVIEQDTTQQVIEQYPTQLVTAQQVIEQAFLQQDTVQPEQGTALQVIEQGTALQDLQQAIAQQVIEQVTTQQDTEQDTIKQVIGKADTVREQDTTQQDTLQPEQDTTHQDTLQSKQKNTVTEKAQKGEGVDTPHLANQVAEGARGWRGEEVGPAYLATQGSGGEEGDTKLVLTQYGSALPLFVRKEDHRVWSQPVNMTSYCVEDREKLLCQDSSDDEMELDTGKVNTDKFETNTNLRDTSEISDEVAVEDLHAFRAPVSLECESPEEASLSHAGAGREVEHLSPPLKRQKLSCDGEQVRTQANEQTSDKAVQTSDKAVQVSSGEELVGDGYETVFQALPTECARQYALVPNVPPCRTQDEGHHSNDRDSPPDNGGGSWGNLNAKGGLKQSPLPLSYAPPQTLCEVEFPVIASPNFDNQLVPEDSWNHPYAHQTLYPDIDTKSKQQPFQTVCLEEDASPDISEPPPSNKSRVVPPVNYHSCFEAPENTNLKTGKLMCMLFSQSGI